MKLSIHSMTISSTHFLALRHNSQTGATHTWYCTIYCGKYFGKEFHGFFERKKSQEVIPLKNNSRSDPFRLQGKRYYQVDGVVGSLEAEACKFFTLNVSIVGMTNTAAIFAFLNISRRVVLISCFSLSIPVFILPLLDFPFTS